MSLLETAGQARRVAERAPPSRAAALAFVAKTWVFRAQRLAGDLAQGPRRLGRGEARDFPVVLAESRTPLWGDPRLAERAMQFGKVHNLRRAAQALDGTLLAPGAVFSFWKQLGPASRARGFVAGRMLVEGCLVPAAGGGLCQLSNALYDVALQAGCRIVERHAHSRIVPGSAAALGRDATVAWNYVDLRFASDVPLLLRVAVERDVLVVGVMAKNSSPACGGGPERSEGGGRKSESFDFPPPASSLRSSSTSPASGGGVGTCGTCTETSCFRHEGHAAATDGRTAFLVDDVWPEFDAFVQSARRDGDVLCLPFDGKRLRLPRYGWRTDGFAVRSAWRQTLWRSLVSRRLAEQGAARQSAQLQACEALARAYAKALAPDVTGLVVTQTLLPFLWRDGHLGGRLFTVLMTRLPLGVLQTRLDAAAAKHPERKTLSDFRAPSWLTAAECEALAAADAVVTPHAEIAEFFGERATRLAWKKPDAVSRAPAASRRIAFVGPTVARKGAYEVREAAKALDLEVALLGSELEGEGFWQGVRTLRPQGDWLSGVAAVVQPALVEEKPRRLMAALAAGVPVIATKACGLPEQDGLTLVAMGDAAALTAALAARI